MKTPLLSWLFLLRICYVSLTFHTFVVSTQCPGDQQSLLLQLKNTLTFDPATSQKLVNWKNGSDYCSWEGVSCKEGCVSNLDLSNEWITGGLDNSSPLFGLKSIENLNLANNSFNYTQIPSEFKQLTGLHNLNLSCAGFAGQVPIEISHLTRLVTLDLSTLYFPGFPSLNLEKPNLNVLIRNFSELLELYLDGVNISAQGNEWCQAISSSLPKLRALSLSNCNLSGPIDSSLLKLHSLSVIRLDYNDFFIQVPEFFSKFPNLTSLHLRGSCLYTCSSLYDRGSCLYGTCAGLYGTFPEKIFQVPTLQTIDLSGNQQLQGSLPEFPKNASLRSLVLSGANFSGLLPNSIGNLKMLSEIDISWCSFTGSIPRSIEDLHQLVYFDMSVNKFNGSVPSFSLAKNLIMINLFHNQLTGQINSTHWQNLTNLMYLDLRSNQLDGTVPLSLFSLPLLQKLQISKNHFSGQLPEFANNSVLDTLDLNSNNLEGPIPMSISNLRGLKIISLSSNNFSGSFPLSALRQIRNLSSLDLSYNSLLITSADINSSYSSFPQLTTLKLSSTKLREFPHFLRNQSNLGTLDLSQNQIHGEIPNWIWRLINLSELNLSCNSLVTLEGPLLGYPPSLSMLDLHSNQLKGQIPMLPQLATYLDYSRNNFSSSIPADIGDFLMYTVFFSLASNKLNGSIPESMCKAPYLQLLDLSSNSLSGMIPQCLIAGSSYIGVLNLRTNNLTGAIPDKFPPSCSLQTVDLNGNQIGGQFPESLGNCNQLEVLNLGNNQITGTFPRSLNKMPLLRVLVFRSNKFYGRIRCPKTYGSWPKLQIIDLAHNNFSGHILGRCLKTWQAMIADEGAGLSQLDHIKFQVLSSLSQIYYDDKVFVTTKGLEMELVKILTIFTSIDLSGNKFTGSIPVEMGELKSLYVLNLSSNALTGEIPSSLGNLQHVESLDLSNNSLSGKIPSQLTNLTFLAFLNLSNNELTGRIPTCTQFSTFPADSFAGNEGLWGPPLTGYIPSGLPLPAPLKKGHSNARPEIDFDLISAEIGFIFGLGAFIGPLVFCKRWRIWYYKTVENIFFKIFPRLDRRSGYRGRHVYINRFWR
ncbi:receptor-like protein 7 [Malus domestica]|uniref:receptor-like protein 7 n=1 Tax=Malus domestica TaxID=3750 RepID=UPI0039768D58